MEIRHIPEKSLKAKNEIHPNCHTESRLFVNDKDLLKIYNSKPNRYRANNISRLSQIIHDGVVTPLYGVSLYNEKNLNGYGMRYYKEFITLRSYLSTHSLSFEERNFIAHRLCTIYNFLLENNFCFFDIHGENVIIKGEEVKFIDVDSSTYIDDLDQSDFNQLVYISRQYLSELCLQVLLSTNLVFSALKKEDKMRIFRRANLEQRKFLLHIFDYNESEFNPEDYIDFFTEGYAKQERRILKI